VAQPEQERTQDAAGYLRAHADAPLVHHRIGCHKRKGGYDVAKYLVNLMLPVHPCHFAAC
jgi:hypothetical protein